LSDAGLEIVDRLGACDAAGLEALLGGRAEGPGYYRAFERTAPSGLGLRYLSVTENGTPVGFAPAFMAGYNWLPGSGRYPAPLRRIGDMRVAGLGSVHANELALCLAGDNDRRRDVFARLLDGLDELGRTERADLLLIKDLCDRDAVHADPVLRRCGYVRMAAPPLAFLHVPQGTGKAFLEDLKGSRRRDLMRNVRKAAAIEVETDADIAGMGPELARLAAGTHARAGTRFGGLETTPPGFYEALAEEAPANISVTLYRLGARLVGFSLQLVDARALYGKTLGLSYPAALEHKVYFLNLMTGIDSCAGRGLDWLCMGQLGYAGKIALGARLERRWYYIKARGAYGPGFRLARRFVEGRRIETESAPYDTPAHLFASDPTGPQPPVRTAFAP